jgi:sulfur-oxidizing protein SoxY
VQRRHVLIATAGAVLLPSAHATPETMAAAVREFTGGAPVRDGGVLFDVPPLVENGNTVPVTVSVDSPMTAADHVKEIGLFDEMNPQPVIAVFGLGPRAGRASVSTRIRLTTSQKLVAIAKMGDGSFRRHQVDVLVTIAACTEG